MIKLEMIAEQIESILNASVLAEISGGNTALDNGRVTYRFRVVFDSGDYVDSNYLVQGMQPEETGAISIEPTNRIVRYINCELTSPESNSQGVIKADFSFNTYLEILIPLVNAGRKAKKMELVTSIRQCIDSAFSLNSLGTMTDESETSYTYGVKYSLMNTGTRDLRAEVGDSITMSASVVYFFIQEGVNSANIKIYDSSVSDAEKEIPYTRLGLSRTAVQESNVTNDTEDGAGKTITTSTVLGINFDMPMRNDSMSRRIFDFILDPKNNEPFEITVQWIVSDSEPPITKSFTMAFAESSVNAETTLNASVSVSLVEALE